MNFSVTPVQLIRAYGLENVVYFPQGTDEECDTPQDGGAEALRRDHATQRGVRGQEVVLPDDLIQLGGAQAVGEWPGGLLIEERQGRFHGSLGRRRA